MNKLKYKNKYAKYKNKYLKLKQHHGGDDDGSHKISMKIDPFCYDTNDAYQNCLPRSLNEIRYVTFASDESRFKKNTHPILNIYTPSKDSSITDDKLRKFIQTLRDKQSKCICITMFFNDTQIYDNDIECKRQDEFFCGLDKGTTVKHEHLKRIFKEGTRQYNMTSDYISAKGYGKINLHNFACKMKLTSYEYFFLTPFNEIKLILLYSQYGFNLIPKLSVVDSEGNRFDHTMMYADINDVISLTAPT
jgi:hypothetical protein